jgi:hypothetical protein
MRSVTLTAVAASSARWPPSTIAGTMTTTVFDPQRQTVLLVVGDKSGRWRRWYEENIPLAEQGYQRWLDGGYSAERTG